MAKEPVYVEPRTATKTTRVGGRRSLGTAESAADIGMRVNTNAVQSKAPPKPGIRKVSRRHASVRTGKLGTSNPARALRRSSKGRQPTVRIPKARQVGHGKKTEESDISPPAPEIGRHGRSNQIREAAERRKRDLGPVGRQRTRADAEPKGKTFTNAPKARKGERPGQKKKPVKGSPSARRRLANREAAVKGRRR